MTAISAVVITYNEESGIDRCIKSLVGISDEIIVVDSFSTDRTPEICSSYGVTFVQNKFDGYKEQKNFALSLANNNYVLSLDGDEALSDELRESILRVKDNLEFDGYYFNRRNNYCGQWIKHSNWYPDKKLRLFNKSKGEWGGINPHDQVIMRSGSKTKSIDADILHWVINSYEEHLDKVNRFTTIAANEYYKLGVKKSVAGMLVHTIWRFFKAYFLRLGICDGYNGFVISVLSSYSSLLKYIKLRKIIRDNKRLKGELN